MSERFANVSVLECCGAGPAFFLLDPSKTCVIGRGNRCDLIFNSGKVAREHAFLHPRAGRWVLESSNSNSGVFIGKALVRQPTVLDDGVSFSLAGGAELTFHEHGLRVPRRNPALEASIAEAPDDADRWLVYGDWLEEQGEPLGARLLRASDDASPAWVGSLKNLMPSWLRIGWRRGVAERVFFDRPVDWANTLELMRARFVFAFVRHVEANLSQLGPQEDPARAVEQLLTGLAGLSAMLETVTVHGVQEWLLPGPWSTALAQLRAGQPRLRTTAETLFSTR